MGRSAPLMTPDGRYVVVRGRLWRATNPHLDPGARDQHVRALMDARRRVKDAIAGNDPVMQAEARAAVDQAKIALGERGPVWWDDDAPDLTRHMARNTDYAQWFASQQGE